MSNYKLLNSAEKDIKNILFYGYENWGILKTNLYVDELYERFEWLAEFPNAARDRGEIGDRIRSWPQGAHTIFFRQRELEIEIMGIFHQRTDQYNL